ncbi:MAG: molybdenum cofactor guanylyltransferase [Thermodesulfobacteriota bacterium]
MSGAAGSLRSGVILAGGRSSRIGQPKALLELGGSPLLLHVARALVPSCDELLVVAAPPAAQPPGLLDDLRRTVGSIARRWRALGGRTTSSLRPRARLVHDARAHLGPCAGLASALAVARGELAFVTACDQPFLSTAVVGELLARGERGARPDVVVARWRGYLEPLVAVYRVASMATHYARQLEEDELRPTARLDRVRVEVVDEADVRTLDPEGLSFVNVNSRADYEAARALVNARRRRPARSRRGSSAGA